MRAPRHLQYEGGNGGHERASAEENDRATAGRCGRRRWWSSSRAAATGCLRGAARRGAGHGRNRTSTSRHDGAVGGAVNTRERRRASRDGGEVGACDTGLVVEVDDDGAVADEATQTGQCGCVEVEVLLGQTGAVDGAVLAAEITDLAGLRLGRIAERVFAALVGVEMGEGAGAVAVGGNGLVVDVVHWVLG